MSIAHLLAEFSTERPDEDAARLISDLELEDERLTAFERGYSAGWEDALKAQGEDRASVIADLRQSLEDMSFTYHDAYSQMMLSLKGIVGTLLETVLPRALQHALVPGIVEEISAQVADHADVAVEVLVSPDLDEEVAAALSSVPSVPITPIETPELKPGQVVLQIGGGGHEIDTGRLLRRIERSVEAYFDQLKQEVRNG